MKRPPLWLRFLFKLIFGVLLFLLCMQLGRCLSGAPVDSFYEETSTIEEEFEEEVNEVLPTENKKEEIPKANEKETSKTQEEPIESKNDAIDSTHILSQKNVHLAKKIDNLLRTFKPAHALYLIVDAKSNEIIAWGENKDMVVQSTPDYLSRSTFPAASLIKTVTLAAALESKQYSLNTPIPLIGNAHTLYKNQLKPKSNYKGETVSIKDAYARSYNPPMAIAGYKVGANALRKAAKQLGFNQSFPKNAPHRSDFSPPDTGYGLAEAASGFTNKTTLSPLLAAAQIRAILYSRPLEIPHAKNISPYAPKKPLALSVSKFSENTYYGLREAMIRSVTNGTARKNISTTYMARKNYNDLQIGGKTGTVDGTSPAGRYEWFAGFARFKENPQEGIVLVVMQAHYNTENATRSQPATQVAAMLINYWAHWSRSKEKEN